MEDAQAQAAAAVASAFLEAPVEAPEPPVSSPAAVEETATTAPDEEASVVEFELSPNVPEDVLRELEEAEIDEQVEAELASRQPTDEYEESYETEDEARERIKLAKRNEYLERELAKVKAGSWKDEALKYFPLSKHAIENINATSRRSFLKQAKAEHEKVLPYVQEALSEASKFVDAEKVAARDEAKKAAQAAFGEPLSGPDVGTIDAAAADAALVAARADARKTGNLTGLFKALMASGK